MNTFISFTSHTCPTHSIILFTCKYCMQTNRIRLPALLYQVCALAVTYNNTEAVQSLIRSIYQKSHATQCEAIRQHQIPLPSPPHSFMVNTGLRRQRLRGFQTRELTNSSECKLPGNSTKETGTPLCSSYTGDSLWGRAERR